MLKPRILAVAALGLVAAACADYPNYPDAYSPPPTAYYSAPAPSYGARGPVYYRPGDVAYNDYGRVVAIDVVDRDSADHGTAGAVIGGIAGGVLGHQIGSGRGNDVATAAGAIGGAVAGHEIGKRHGGERYRITVEFPDRRVATFEQSDLNGLRVGDRVRVAGDHLEHG